MEKLDRSSECWLWTAAVKPNGYGMFHDGRTIRNAHRWSYEHFVGPIPDGLQLDHLCRVRHCVNPAHLEPVTSRTNIVRGDGPSVTRARHAAKTHCQRGHPYDEANTRWYRGERKCRACNRDRMRRRSTAA